jgi:hypothetical protein
MRDQNRPSRGCCGVVAGELEARARALVDGLRGEGYWDRILGADMREIVRQVLEAAPPPPPSDLGTKLREDVARIIHAEIAGTDPDELIHHPAAKSWETPTEPRWTQWLELTDAIHALYASLIDAQRVRIEEKNVIIERWERAMIEVTERAQAAEADNLTKDGRIAELEDENSRLRQGLFGGQVMTRVAEDRTRYDARTALSTRTATISQEGKDHG